MLAESGAPLHVLDLLSSLIILKFLWFPAVYFYAVEILLYNGLVDSFYIPLIFCDSLNVVGEEIDDFSACFYFPIYLLLSATVPILSVILLS